MVAESAAWFGPHMWLDFGVRRGPSATPTPTPPKPSAPATQPSVAPVTKPAAVAQAWVGFPKKRTAVVSWKAPARATAYKVRISKKNSKTKFKAWRTVTTPNAKFTKLKKKAKYRVQITAINKAGTSQIHTYKFKQKK
jgi:hypothetical protein